MQAVALPELTPERIAALDERYPPLFRRISDRLFGPLASPNRMRYWELLCALHGKRFGPDAPLPPGAGFLMAEIVQDIALEMSFQSWSLEGEELATPLSIRANMAFHTLREAGWLRVDRVGVREMVTMPPASAQFLNRLVDFAQTGPEFVSGKIRSIAANVRDLLESNADGASLQEVARQSRALLEHVRIAGTNVRDLMAEISNEHATAEFVRRFFTDFVEKMFIGDYKELRTREHPLARRQEILRMVAQIQETPEVRSRLLQWYAAKPAAGDARRAELLFSRDIQRLEDLRRIDEYLERLDDEIRRANRMALAYIDYRLRASRPLDLLIDHAIDAVLRLDEHGTLPEPFAPGECVHAMGLAVPRQARRRPAAAELRRQAMSPHARARALLHLRARDRRTVSAAKLSAFVREQLAGRDTIDSRALKVDSVEALRALQTLCTISMANASGRRGLKMVARSMSIGFTTERVETAVDTSQPISHVPFAIESKVKKKG